MTSDHFAGTTEQSRKTASEEISLQTTTENRQWLCRRDVVWQTVPNSRGGDRKSSVAVRRQPRTAAYNQRWWRARPNVDDAEPTDLPSGRCRRRGTTALHPLDNYRVISMHFTMQYYRSRLCVAYYEFPGWTTFQMKSSADLPATTHTNHLYHTSRSSLTTSHVPIHPWTTAQHSDPVLPPCHGTGTADQAELIKLGSGQLNLMSLDLTLVWQLPIIEHKTDKHGGHSWKRRRPFDKPHSDDDHDTSRILAYCHFSVHWRLVQPLL